MENDGKVCGHLKSKYKNSKLDEKIAPNEVNYNTELICNLTGLECVASKYEHDSNSGFTSIYLPEIARKCPRLLVDGKDQEYMRKLRTKKSELEEELKSLTGE